MTNTTPADLNVTAFEILQAVTNPPRKNLAILNNRREKNPAAVTHGRLGGIKGGKARAQKLKGIETEAAPARSPYSFGSFVH